MFRFKVNRTFIINTLTPLGGLEPPSFRLTAERASQLRHRGRVVLEPYSQKSRKV